MSINLFATTVGDVSGGYSTEDLLDTHTGKVAAILMLCVKLCLANVKCLSIFYNQSQQKCLLNAAVFFHSNSPSFVSEQGWRHYRTSGDIRCEVAKGFIHNRELNMCYSPRTSEADSALSSSMCGDMNGKLGKVDSSAKLNHLNKTIHAMPLNISTDGGGGGGGATYFACWQRSGTDCAYNNNDLGNTPEKCAENCKTISKTIAYLEPTWCYCCTMTTDPSKKLPDNMCITQCGGSADPCGSGASGTGALYNIQSGTKGKTVNFYIGLTKVSSTWKWTVDNTVAGYTAFEDTSSGSCAVMTSAHNFRWSSVDCSSNAGSICEITLN